MYSELFKVRKFWSLSHFLMTHVHKMREDVVTIVWFWQLNLFFQQRWRLNTCKLSKHSLVTFMSEWIKRNHYLFNFCFLFFLYFFTLFRGLKALVTPFLAALLEKDPDKIFSFDEFFESVNDITSRIHYHIFWPQAFSLLTVYAREQAE